MLAPFLANSQTGEKNFIDQNYIEVTGKSEMEVTPDLIYLKILLNEKDNKNKQPLADRENQMLSKLRDIGIDTNKDLLMKDMASNFKDYLLIKSDILLSKEYQLLVRDGKTASKVFVELENIGISNVSIERIDNSEIQKFRKQVKIAAIKAAKEKSEALANAIGQNVGRAIFIQELDNYYGNGGASGGASNIRIRGTGSIHRASSEEPEIDFEKIRLEYSIMCRFELK
jgi:uncharacterized protein YggE